MAIITISRELAALGDETARELAKQLGFRYIDKHALEGRIKSYGIEHKKLKKYDGRKPSFFASLSHDRDEYLHYLKTAILAEAGQGGCVFIGRGAGAVLKKMPAIISLFLASPLDIRIERVKSYFQCDERRARQIIEHSDHDRIGFHRYFFDMDWKDPGNYHLSLNTGILHPGDCAEIIGKMKDVLFTPELENKNAACLKELSLELNIKHSILYEHEIPIHFLEVAISGGTVTLYGVANSPAPLEAALNAARQSAEQLCAGAAAIQNEIQIVREYTVMP